MSRIIASRGGPREVPLTDEQIAQREADAQSAADDRAAREQAKLAKAIKLSALPGNENSVPALRQKINDILKILRDGGAS